MLISKAKAILAGMISMRYFAVARSSEQADTIISTWCSSLSARRAPGQKARVPAGALRPLVNSVVAAGFPMEWVTISASDRGKRSMEINFAVVSARFNPVISAHGAKSAFIS